MNHASIKEFIADYVDLSYSEMEDVTGRFRAKSIERHTFLLREGEVCRDLVFVSKGCLRLFYLKNDVEISVWFSFQGSSAIEIKQFY